MSAQSEAKPGAKKRPPGPGRGHKIKQGNGYVHKPPSGIPASGPGWGGEAKGPGIPLAEYHQRVRSPPASPAEREALAQEALETMVAVMRDSEYDATRLAAAEKVRNQIMGTPIQRTIVDHQPIERRTVDPRRLSPEARDALREILDAEAAERAVPVNTKQ